MEYILLVTQIITIFMLLRFNKKVQILNSENNYLECKNKNVISESKKLKQKLVEITEKDENDD